MYVPRLIYRAKETKITDLKSEAQHWATEAGQCILLIGLDNNVPEELALETKKISLFHQALLILQDDIATAAKINADGVLLSSANQSFQARESLGSDKLIGAFAMDIAQIADLNEEAVIDFIVLGRTDELEYSMNPFTIRQVIDDCRIMGYNIPLIIPSIVTVEEAEKCFKMGVYGIIFDDLENQLALQELVKGYPLKS